MTEKSVSKYLLQLENHFANNSPVLLQVSKAYHELDQIAFDLGLLEMDETIASSTSWWPLITMIGAPESGKSGFINNYLQSSILQTEAQTSGARVSVLNYSDNEQLVTLPGTALDRDPRFPFYRISDKLNLLKSGEGRNINSYLELKTCNSPTLNGKIIVSAPSFAADNPVISLLTQHADAQSDLVFVFFDAAQVDLENQKEALKNFFSSTGSSQNPGKYCFIINHWGTHSDTLDLSDWKNKLAQYGLETGEFFVLQGQTNQQPTPQTSGFIPQKQTPQIPKEQNIIEQKIANVNIDSAYRILHSLERSINDLDEVVIEEVRKGIKTWKDRVHFTLTLVLSGLAFLLVLAEINLGFLSVLIDPIVGPVALLGLILVMLPLHIYSSKQHAKWIIKDLDQRQNELGLVENLSGLFEKSLTFWRILLPIKEPVGWNNETQSRLRHLLERSKELVQSLNDSFSTISHKTFIS